MLHQQLEGGFTTNGRRKLGTAEGLLRLTKSMVCLISGDNY